MFWFHGLGKLERYSRLMTRFPDPLGIGNEYSLMLVIFAEVICSFFVIIGLFTRLALIPLIITMAVAFFIIHADDPFLKKELSFLFLTGFSALFFAGSGYLHIKLPIFKPKSKFLRWLLEIK